MEDNGLIGLKDACAELSISVATGKNWLKLGKMLPSLVEGKTAYFTRAYLDQLKLELQSGQNRALKSRRNKKYVSGNSLYKAYVSEKSVNVAHVQKLLAIFSCQKIEISNDIIKCVLAECAVCLLSKALNVSNHRHRYFLSGFLKHEIDLGGFSCFITDLLQGVVNVDAIIRDNLCLFEIDYELESHEDIIGLLYISCKNVANRKAIGAYYTPTSVVKKLIDALFENENKKSEKRVLDPCCGTGNFLLQLSDEFVVNNIFANDIDEISVKITRINLAIKYRPTDVKVLYTNVTQINYLADYHNTEFDYILGNPPWGYNFSEGESMFLRQNYDSAMGKNVESYDVFIECALKHMKKGGKLSFVLPEAILNVKAHAPIRQFIIDNTSISFLSYLGNTFDKVQCPCIILEMTNTGEKINCCGLKVNDNGKEYILKKDRVVSSDYFSFLTTDDEQSVLDKINNVTPKEKLEGKAVFALGIVTGDNKSYISSEKNSANEMILKGIDIYKYKASESGNYIDFKPESFQQIAPIEYYRAPEKLLYRFICNQLVFAYDDQQRLSLNSCNIVIPKIHDLSVKYIMAILNSRMAQFVFKKQFNSVKVLRSHIEQMPIPIADQATQEMIQEKVDLLIASQDEQLLNELYDDLDSEIKKLYKLTEHEYSIIKQSMATENLFLV